MNFELEWFRYILPFANFNFGRFRKSNDDFSEHAFNSFALNIERMRMRTNFPSKSREVLGYVVFIFFSVCTALNLIFTSSSR